MCLFFFLEMLLELVDPLLHISVDLQVPLHYALHYRYVRINVVLLWPYALHVGDQLAFFCQQLGCLFQILKVFVDEFFFFIYDLVNFLVECQHLRVYKLWVVLVFKLITTLAKALTPIESLLQIVPILFLLLFHLNWPLVFFLWWRIILLLFWRLDFRFWLLSVVFGPLLTLFLFNWLRLLGNLLWVLCYGYWVLLYLIHYYSLLLLLLLLNLSLIA